MSTTNSVTDARSGYEDLFMSTIGSGQFDVQNDEKPEVPDGTPPSNTQQNLADIKNLDVLAKTALGKETHSLLPLLNILSSNDETLKEAHDALLTAVKNCGELGGKFLGELFSKVNPENPEWEWSENHIHEHPAELREIVEGEVKALVDAIVDDSFDGDIYHASDDEKKGGDNWGKENRYTNYNWTFAALNTFIDRKIKDASNDGELAKFDNSPLLNEANREALAAKKLELNPPPKTTLEKLKDLLDGNDQNLIAEVAKMSADNSIGDFPAAVKKLQDTYQIFLPIMPLVEAPQAPTDDVAAAALFQHCAEFFTAVKAAFQAEVGDEDLHKEHSQLNTAIMSEFKKKFEWDYADSLGRFDGKFYEVAKQAEADNGQPDWDGGAGWATHNRYIETQHFAKALEAHHAGLLREAIQAL